MRILLAEDDAVIADGLIRSLRREGYAVDHVANGADADAALCAQSFDLVILDLQSIRMSVSANPVFEVRESGYLSLSIIGRTVSARRDSGRLSTTENRGHPRRFGLCR